MCVNLIIQIFIYTVRKNLLIFISAQAPPQSPTSLLTTHHDEVDGQPLLPSTHPGKQGQAGQGAVGIRLLS